MTNQNFVDVIILCRYGIEQVQPKVVFTSYHLIPKLMKILSTFPNDIIHIIYFEHPLRSGGCSDPTMLSIVTIPLSKIESDGIAGKENEHATTAGKSL